MKLKELKAKNKEIVALIKEGNRLYRAANTPETLKAYWEWCAKNSVSGGLSRKYRHMHIAYCLLRGRTYEQVESYVRPGNEPNMKIVEDIMAQYKEVQDADVRAGEA
jgi:hypothetical protein